MRILMVAAENDALPGAKVGGIGDVVRDIPIALSELNHHVNVVIPSYGALSTLVNAQFMGRILVKFTGNLESVDLFKINLPQQNPGITQWVLEHPLFAIGGIGQVYCDDPDHRPFASDANKFSLFCAAVATGIMDKVFGEVDILHLHDWHAAMVAVLRRYDPKFSPLQKIHTVYTIHNLALQGIRPFKNDESSLEHWFSDLPYTGVDICDPAYPQCFNPMRAGINLSDKIHAVSVNYAQEILQASDYHRGYYGGEGLEMDLQRAQTEQRLQGILNGCEYPKQEQSAVMPFPDLLRTIENELLKWMSKSPTSTVESSHLIAMTRLRQYLERDLQPDDRNRILLTSIGRITAQKVRLLAQTMDDGRYALSHLLEILHHKTQGKGLFIILGSGDKQLEKYLTQITAKHQNLIYLQGYSQHLPNLLYPAGQLFIMPSSFEPCGISQMLAMRSGQPCLAHGVGGLSDTILHEENGFIFNGTDPMDQAKQMLLTFEHAINIYQNHGEQWQTIAAKALASRFLWSDVARHYVNKLYQPHLVE